MSGKSVENYLTNKVLALWVITYDRNPELTYVFTDSEVAFNSVVNSVSTYADPQEEVPDCDPGLAQFIEILKSKWHEAHISLQINSLCIFVHRLELDTHNPLFILLRDLYDVLDNRMPMDRGRRLALKSKIAKLFRDSEPA